MKKNLILFLVVVCCLIVPNCQATITNDTQATGPFADIDQAMADANPGDDFTVTGSTGGGTIDVDGVTLTAATGGGADVVGESVVDAQGVIVEGVTFDAAGANTPVLTIAGKADLTATDCEFLNAGTAPAEIDGVVVGDGIDPAALTADGCLFSNSTLYNLNLVSAGSLATLTQCNIENSPNDAVHITGDDSVLKMTDCFIGNNLDVGVKSGANGTLMELRNCNFNNNGSRHVETDSDYVDQICNVIDCTMRGGADRVIRFKGDTGEYLLSNCFVDGNGESGIRLGDADSSTLNVVDTCFYNTDRMIRVDGDPSGITGIGGNNTVNLDNSTFYLSSRGMVNETPATNPNTWNINYCVIAQWDGTSRIGLDNQDAGSAFNENNNVLANTEPAAQVRNNVTPGANSVDDLQANAITNLFCDTNPLNADFMKVLTTSATLNIDGVGGLAGGKTLCPATNPIVRGTDGAEFADLDAAVSDAGTLAGESLYVTAAAGGGLVNKDSISVVGPGPIDAFGGTTSSAMIDVVDANNVLIHNLTVEGTAAASGPVVQVVTSTVDLDNVSVISAGEVGVQVGGTGSGLNVDSCLVDNSGVNNLNVGGTNATISIQDSVLSYSGDENINSGGSGHNFSFLNSILTEGGKENYRSRVDGGFTEFIDCELTNAGRSLDPLGNVNPLGSRDNCVRMRGDAERVDVSGCVLSGNDTTFRVDSGTGMELNVTDTCVFNCGRGSRMRDDLTNSTYNFTNVTFDNCLRGLRDDGTPSDVGNVWNVQYCIISDWTEVPGALPGDQRWGFDDQTGFSTINENNNVYADNDVATTGRNNVVPGPNSIDLNEPLNLYCSQVPNNPLHLHIADNSGVTNIDGIGGDPGCKPVSCTIVPVSSMASSTGNWYLYD